MLTTFIPGQFCILSLPGRVDDVIEMFEGLILGCLYQFGIALDSAVCRYAPLAWGSRQRYVGVHQVTKILHTIIQSMITSILLLYPSLDLSISEWHGADVSLGLT